MPAASNRPGQAVGGGRGQPGQVGRLARQVERGRVAGGQRLEVTDHARQPQHLVPQRAELGRGGFGHAVEQGLVPRLQDGDRGPQLVGDVSDQVPADLLPPVQGAGHLVEGGRQLAQFPRRADVAYPGGPVPARHGPGRRDQPRHRAGDPPGHGQPGKQGQQGGQADRPGDGPQQRGLQAAVGGAQAGTGDPHHDGADAPAAHRDRLAFPRPARAGEVVRLLDDGAGLVEDLDGHPGPRGLVGDRDRSAADQVSFRS
jgi:hypothetical protein